MRVEYKYDVLGNRIKRLEYNSFGTLVKEERFSYDGWKTGPALYGAVGNENYDVAFDLDNTNALVYRRIFGNSVDTVQARIDPLGTVAYYDTDHQGSVRYMTNGAGTVQATIVYDGFGSVASNSNPTFTDRYEYTGMELDTSTGIEHVGARDVENAQFLEEDPDRFDAGDANLKRDVGNSFPNATDPSGLIPWPEDGGDIEVLRAANTENVKPVGYSFGRPTLLVDKTSVIQSYPFYAYEAPRLDPDGATETVCDVKYVLYAQRFFVQYVNFNMSVKKPDYDAMKSLGKSFEIVSTLTPGGWVIKAGKLTIGSKIKEEILEFGKQENVTVNDFVTKWQYAYIVYYWTSNGKIASSGPNGKPLGYITLGALPDKKNFNSKKELQKIIEDNKKTWLGFNLDQ